MATRKQATSNTGEGAEGEQTVWGVPIPGTGGPVGAGAIAARDEIPELEPGQKIVMLLNGGSLSDETQVRVYKRLPNSTKYAWCKNYNAHEFLAGDLEMIRTEWGPGEYSMRVYGGPNGMEREDVTISAPIVGSNPANPVPTQVAMQHQSDLARVLEKISEQNAALLTAVSQKPDPMQGLSAALEMAKSMREAFGIGGVVPAVAAPAPVPVLQQITEMAGAMRAFREVAKEMGDQGGGADPDNPMTLVSQIVELTKAGLSARQNPALPAPMQPIQPMLIPETLQQPQQSQTEEPGHILMRGILTTLLAIKTSGGTIEQGGEYIAEKIPDELLPYLDLPNWFELACVYAPVIKPHEEWVKAATAHAVKLLAADSAG